MPAMALSRVAARAVESGPDGENLAARCVAAPGSAARPALAARADLPAGLPDRGRRLRVHRRRERPVHRGRAVDQAAGQADLARLHARWDPIAGRYRAPDEKTIRMVLDRLDPRALTRALLGPRRRRGGAAPASVPHPGAPPSGQNAGPREVTGRGRGRKTSRGGHSPDGTRVHLLGVAEHGGHLLDIPPLGTDIPSPGTAGSWLRPAGPLSYPNPGIWINTAVSAAAEGPRPVGMTDHGYRDGSQ